MIDQNNTGVAIVTGAAGVLGEAIARRLHADGMLVVLVDLDDQRVQQIARSLGTRSLGRSLDVRSSGDINGLCDEIRNHHGGVQVLVNNAGILSNNKVADTTDDEWRKVMAVNLDGAFYFARACLPGMMSRGFGRIVNICSLAMKTGGLTAGTAYTASKGAMGALTFSLARESAKFGVTVNGIAPAYIRTPMVTEQLTREQQAQLLREIPVGRFCEPQEVAELVRYLVQPYSGFITGEIIDINGGLHLD